MRFINLTPNTIRIRVPDIASQILEYREIEIEPSGLVAKVPCYHKDPEHLIDGIPVYEPPVNGRPEGLPNPAEGVAFLVSANFIGKVGSRTDVFCPATGTNDYVQNEHVVATRLIRCGEVASRRPNPAHPQENEVALAERIGKNYSDLLGHIRSEFALSDSSATRIVAMVLSWYEEESVDG